MSPTVNVLLTLLTGFLLGSIPSGYLIGRWMRQIDLREVGSGNLGATNVYRSLGLGPALVVLAADMGKGALAVYLGLHVYPELTARLPDLTALVAALAAVLGHSLSPFVGFRGGKGVATAAGSFLVLAALPTLAALLVWGIILASTRVMSIASIAAAVVLPVCLGLVESVRPAGDERRWATLIFAIAIAIWVIWRHRSNISRLRDGTESRLW
jgi:glycerol-3-phosphate acyltransferase PlsY